MVAMIIPKGDLDGDSPRVAPTCWRFRKIHWEGEEMLPSLWWLSLRREMTQNAMSRSGKAASQGVSRQVCQQGLLLDASELGLRGGGWWKIADLIWALSALSVRHDKTYSCTEKPIKAFVS